MNASKRLLVAIGISIMILIMKATYPIGAIMKLATVKNIREMRATGM